MRTPLALGALLVVPLLSGCFGGGSPDEPDEPVAPPPAPPVDIPSVWFFTVNQTLETVTPQGERPGERVRVAWSWAEYYTGTPPPFWEGPLADAPYRITSAVAEIHFAGRQETIDPGLRPGLTAWFGAGDSVVAHEFFEGPQMIGRDQVVNATFNFTLPPGGLVVEPGEAFRVHVGDYYLDANAMTVGGRIQVLVGSLLTPTHLYIEAEPVTLPEAAESNILAESGTLRGDACGPAPAQTRPDSERTFDLTLPDGAVGMRIRLTTTHIAGGYDVDLDLMGPDDGLFATAWSPGGNEALDLLRPNLAAAGNGTWSLRMYTCQEQVVDYSLTVVALVPTVAETAGPGTAARR